MALCHIHWFSKILGKQIATNVIVPEGASPPFATFYLLHGLSDDYTIWQRRTRVEAYVERLPLIIVMPDGFRGFYTNNAQGPAYATHFAEELPAFIERTFPAKSGRANRCVGGLSMGGYGALRLALGYPNIYASATCHSGAVMHGTRKPEKSALDDNEFARVFGKSPAGTEHDLQHLALQIKKKKLRMPAVRIDCGTEDFLLKDNRQFQSFLEKNAIPHEYEEFPGEHNWDYWDTHVRRALDFHAKHLKLKRIGN